MDPGLRLKFVYHALIDVFAPVVYIELIRVGGRKVQVAGICHASNDQEGGKHDRCLSGPCRFLSTVRCCVRSEAARSRLRLRFCRSKVCNEQQREHSHKDHCGERVHGRLDAAAHLTVDQRGQGVDPGAFCEVGDDKIIQRHRKRHQEAR